jgi:zinc/manganese transport system substrate-binding protein
MEKRRKIVFAVIAAVAIAGAGTFAYVTSAAASNPCAGVALGLPTNSTTSTAADAAATPAANVAEPTTASPRVTAEPTTASPRVTAEPAAATSPASTYSPADPIQVVAAENFWGSLVSQLGGNLTHVISIITDPNTDPHEYEANATDSKEIANAKYVIVNGVGYDQWAIEEFVANANSSQVLLNVGTLNGVSVTGGIVTGNPHMWYNPVYVNNTVAAMYHNLTTIAPANTSYFLANYETLNASLATLYHQAGEIRKEHAGTVVASTESIFVYLANFTDLDLVSPPAFMEAIAEGNDPPVQSVVTFECQLESHQVSVLVYNLQTVTPITTQMKAIAAANNVTYTWVTETIQPPTYTFQAWMSSEYLYLADALNASKLGS